MKFSLFAFSLLLLASVCFASWTTPVNASSGFAANIQYSSLFVDNDYNYHVVWQNTAPGNPSNTEVYYAKSTDGGVTWSAPVNVSNTSTYTDIPDIVADSAGRIFITWGETIEGKSDVFVRVSEDNGNTWGGAVNASNTTNVEENFPNIIVDPSDNLYLFFEGSPSPNPQEVYFSKSTDHGVTWSVPFNISGTTSSVSYQPSATTDSSGNVYLVFTEQVSPGSYDTVFTKSTNGSVWSELVNVSNDTATVTNYGDIAVSGSNIYVTWESNFGGGTDIFIRKSTDSGATWGEVTNISNRSPENDNLATVVTDSAGNVYMAWVYESDDGSYANITVVTSEDYGATWSSPQLISREAADLYPMVHREGLFIDDQGRVCAAFENWFDDGSYANIDFVKLFTEPVHMNYTIKDADDTAIDYNSTSIKINNSLANLTWRGLNASQVYTLSNKNLSSTITITSNADSASITVSEATLNVSANVTISGLSGITASGLVIKHDGVTAYENSAVVPGQGLTSASFVGGTLTMEVESFSEWTVEEGAGSGVSTAFVTPAPGLNLAGVAIMFLLAASVFLIKKG